MTALERLITGDIHRQDEDCIIDPDTNLCISCGVMRGDECPACHARSFHRDNCPFMLTITEATPLGESDLSLAPKYPVVVPDEEDNIGGQGAELITVIYAAVMTGLLAWVCHLAHIL